MRVSVPTILMACGSPERPHTAMNFQSTTWKKDKDNPPIIKSGTGKSIILFDDFPSSPPCASIYREFSAATFDDRMGKKAHTVDGRNPAPVDRWFIPYYNPIIIPLFTVFHSDHELPTGDSDFATIRSSITAEFSGQWLRYGCTGTRHDLARWLQEEILLGFHLQLSCHLVKYPQPPSKPKKRGWQWPVIDDLNREFVDDLPILKKMIFTDTLGSNISLTVSPSVPRDHHVLSHRNPGKHGKQQG